MITSYERCKYTNYKYRTNDERQPLNGFVQEYLNIISYSPIKYKEYFSRKTEIIFAKNKFRKKNFISSWALSISS